MSCVICGSLRILSMKNMMTVCIHIMDYCGHIFLMFRLICGWICWEQGCWWDDRIDENEVVGELTENKTKLNHSRNTSKYDTSLDLSIALRKGRWSCTKYSMSKYVSYEYLLPRFRAFTASLDFTTIPKSIHLGLECLKWKVAVMEEMRALEKNKTYDLCTPPKGHKTVGWK